MLDRSTRTILPDNTVTTMAYGFGSDRDGLTQFQTVVTDANGKRKASFRDVQEQITAVQEFNQGQTLWASYRCSRRPPLAWPDSHLATKCRAAASCVSSRCAQLRRYFRGAR